jgi:hypothetical protein
MTGHGHGEVVDNYAERRRVNEASRVFATRNKAPWTEDDDAFLLAEWIDVAPANRDEFTIAQCLERTVEACRVRTEIIRARLNMKGATPVAPKSEAYIAKDDDEDAWWSPSYYTRNQEGR